LADFDEALMMITDDGKYLIVEFRSKSRSKVEPHVFVYDNADSPGYQLIYCKNRRTWQVSPHEIPKVGKNTALFSCVSPDGNAIVVGTPQASGTGQVTLEQFSCTRVAGGMICAEPLKVNFHGRPIFGFPRNTDGLPEDIAGRVVCMQGTPEQLQSVQRSGVQGCMWKGADSAVAFDTRLAELDAAAMVHAVAHFDCYCYYFGFDFLAYLFSGCWAAFGVPSGQGADVKTSTFSWLFVGVMVIQFCFIVVDRILYLFSTSKAKHLYNIVMVFFYYIFLECYVFKYGPMDSNTGLWEHRYTEPTGEALVVMFLLCKAAYFALSALQAMHGFPHQNSPSSHTKGNFLQRLPKDENSVECPPTALQYYTFMVYLFIPFLYELRTFLDWTCMPTTLVFYQWLKVEDISNELFQMQYIGWSRSPQKLHRRLGQPLSWQLKVGMGGFGFLALCLIIWAPLLLFAPSVLTTVQNPIRRFDADLSITVEHLPFRLYEGAQVRPCSCPKWPNGSVIAPDHLQQAFDGILYPWGWGVSVSGDAADVQRCVGSPCSACQAADTCVEHDCSC